MAIVFGPDANVLQLTVGCGAGSQHFRAMAPVHALEVHRAVCRIGREMAEYGLKECRELSDNSSFRVSPKRVTAGPAATSKTASAASSSLPASDNSPIKTSIAGSSNPVTVTSKSTSSAVRY